MSCESDGSGVTDENSARTLDHCFKRMREADIDSLSGWVSVNVIKKIRQLTDKGHHGPFAMNISAKNLTDSHLVDKLQSFIDKENTVPELLEIEITKSALINYPQRAVQSKMRLDKLGVIIATDDSGTGDSSLSYLKQLPPNLLKIDCNFVKDMLLMN